jgi:hypothetical protein
VWLGGLWADTATVALKDSLAPHYFMGKAFIVAEMAMLICPHKADSSVWRYF